MLDTRTSGDGIRRRRQCLACNHRLTTHERMELKLPLGVKNDGRREPFDRDKVVRGLQTACRKRPIPAAALEAAADEIEGALEATGLAEIPATEVGSRVLEQLRALDVVGYVRFASVYLDFQSPAEFLALLQPWLDGPPPEPT